MTQHEQKPESAEPRTWDDLLPCPFCGAPAERLDFDNGENIGGSCISCTGCGASGHVEFGFKENFVSQWNTRVSNAAEQRRKDVEGAEPVAWCLMTADGQIINGIHEEKHQAETCRHRKASDTLTPLYTGPANVAALEDRVKELEGALSYLKDEALRFASFYPSGNDARNTFVLFAGKIADRAAAIREGGEV